MAHNKSIDLDRLRTSITTSGVEERVEVNQRHLIDKILARYSTEYVVFRELMQNADDASSKAVTISFLTKPVTSTQPTLFGIHHKEKCYRIIFRNNGIPFRPEDWKRLKSIAEGNPDEQKIGAFGVGFYSLFSVCENPFVSSGTQCMDFHFKGDQLFAKRGEVPKEDQSEWTTFLMDMREPSAMPNLDEFARFLATSLGFTANLRDITVYHNDNIMFSLKKSMADTRPMKLSRDFNTVSPQKIFTLNSVNIRKIQLELEKVSTNSKHRNGETPREKSTIFLGIVTGNLDVKVPREFEIEMERSTKKKPPKNTTSSLIFTGKEEFDASEKQNVVFKDLIAYPNQGRVFIGFPTHQTTGCSSHMATRFIPTVERESIDFVDKYIGIWNRELLSMGGLLCRIVYEDELEQINRLFTELIGKVKVYEKKPISNDSDTSVVTWLENRAIHAMLSFQFKPSTPSPIVGQLQEKYFMEMAQVPTSIMTTHGVVRVNEARMPNPEICEFVKTVPIVSPEVVKQCEPILKRWRELGLLKEISIDDVFRELKERVLTEAEMISLLKWWINYSTSFIVPESTRATLLDLAIINIEGNNVTPLSQIRFWLNPRIVPSDVPLPPTLLPYEISKNLKLEALAKAFPKWRELSLIDWSQYIITNPNLEVAPSFAEKILGVVSRAFLSLSAQDQKTVIELFTKKKCIPTKQGMKLPSQAYFPSVKLFDDLPIIVFENSKPSEKLLTELGVRKHVELQLVFNRLIADGSWSHIDLIKYLASVSATLSTEEIARLRETKMFPKEGEAPRVTKNADGTDGKRIITRYKALELYSPIDALRGLKLPILEYPIGKWNKGSDEAKFLINSLGLQTYPPLDVILNLAATLPDKSSRSNALNYFINNFKMFYESVYNAAVVTVLFLPCADGTTYATPSNCFLSPACGILGFNVLHQDLRSQADKLGVAEHPKVQALLQKFLSDIPKDREKAIKIFEYLGSRQGDFSYNNWSTLRNQKFIPVPDKKSPDGVRLVDPLQCYFESDEPNSNKDVYKELFTYVNFGSDSANAFLRACGVKTEPTTVELAQMIVNNPPRFYNLCGGGGDRYLGVLRQIASQYDTIKQHRSLVNEMKNSQFLIGIKRLVPAEGGTAEAASEPKEEDDEILQYVLTRAKEVFINDDSVANQVFAPLTVPIEPLLEGFYEQLGSSRLSRQIKETFTYHGTPKQTQRSEGIQQLINERAAIIQYQMMQDDPQRKRELIHDEKWLKMNLKVMQADEIKINRTFTHTGKINVQSTTACVDTVKCIIYISARGELDYYDISNCLCRIFFNRTRFNDSLIIERYLTATLQQLRRKGVPVDRILNLKKAPEPPIVPPEVSETPYEKTPPPPPPAKQPNRQIDNYLAEVLKVFPDADPQYVRKLLEQEKNDHVQRVINKLLDTNYPKIQQVPGSFPSNDRELQSRGDTDVKSNDILSTPTKPNSFVSKWANRFSSLTGGNSETTSSLRENKPEPLQPHRPQLPKPTQTISPNYSKNIEENLRHSIQSCKPNGEAGVFSKPEYNNVTESHSSYCDVRPGQSLISAGRIGTMEFYVHQDINPDDVLSKYSTSSKQFVDLLKELAQVFGLKSTAMHLYYDNEGPTIAFNRSGSLFFNLRYYLALHESPSDKPKAMIYWFMTICHELAHNFVSDHNSEHEFYMSAFAEQYLENLIARLPSQETETPQRS